MIDREQAEQLAAVWARRDSVRLGRECRPAVSEFDLGYVITSTVSTQVTPLPGDLPTTVVDKRTGEVSTWPRVSPDVVARLYRRSRAAGRPAPRTVDPAGQLLREIHRSPAPTTTARLSVERRIVTAQGVKGDVELNHHPLVRAYLDSQPTGHLVRGATRHAEFVAVSDLLYEYDHRRTVEGITALSMGDAKDLLTSARFDVFQVREPGDPHGGPAERPCDSCLNMLVEFNVLAGTELAHTTPWFPEPASAAVPGRFPPQVAQALVAAGWRPYSAGVAAVGPAGHQVGVAADRAHGLAAVGALPRLRSQRRGPGEQVWISRFEIDPRQVAQTAESLRDFAAVVGTRMHPIGTESRHSIVAADELGRIFALDQAGEWFLGIDIDAALTTLLLGRAPARVRDDGGW
ncbi:SUKH-3 domain-containing protein [Verrucosispora sp. WMMA2121]|uniref:SUKH-3 domain-containing protein n=1 Tax=Verrucosispora sp. WMMA2121 TaxID=3015164 RepID=UPI0022B67B0F|nr:SUKH-3 domain-containing protein [Verrucosispora sp. WMMA2121]MCZ7420795.1 SUKH-3 domain-containing protein [Verrucosispora sp. WMMA2121]